jgi:L-seryl-tRNA(Ser) seleniumtransferase
VRPWSRSGPPTGPGSTTTEPAIGRGHGLLLKVHRSNFRQVGFTQDVAASELAGLAAETGVPFVYDLGSG